MLNTGLRSGAEPENVGESPGLLTSTKSATNGSLSKLDSLLYLIRSRYDVIGTIVIICGREF